MEQSSSGQEQSFTHSGTVLRRLQEKPKNPKATRAGNLGIVEFGRTLLHHLQAQEALAALAGG